LKMKNCKKDGRKKNDILKPTSMLEVSHSINKMKYNYYKLQMN
jgi:hypothetical protein